MPRTGGVYSPPAGTKGVPNTTILSNAYNSFVDDLTADANAARPITAGGTGATSASAARTALGLAIGTNVQAYDAGLQSISGLTTVANQMLYTTATDVYATTALTPFARTILDDTTGAAVLSTLGVTAYAQTLLDDSSAATARATLELTDNNIASYVLNSFGAYVPSGQNFNSLVQGDRGLYGTAGALNAPPAPGGIQFWFVENRKMYASSVMQQIATAYYASAAQGDPVIYIRFRGSDGTTWGTWRRLLTTADVGTGSGLDADLLDGQHGAYYLNAANLTGTVADARLPATQAGKTFTSPMSLSSADPNFNFVETDTSTAARIMISAGETYIQAGATGSGAASSSGILRISGYQNADISAVTIRDNGANNTVWHAGNDGAGSGLDADLLDGQQGTYYLNAGNFTGTIADARLPTSMAGKTFTSLTYITAGTAATAGALLVLNPTDFGAGKPGLFFNRDNATTWRVSTYDGTGNVGTLSFASAQVLINGGTAWHSGNDGAGSGLDADLLDGVQLAGLVQTSRTITAGTGLSGGGDLSANRTLAVSYGTAAGTAAQGNDSRIVNAVPNTRTVTAGNGMTGGGALSANITVTMGTPGNITNSTTNSVSATSHTHALGFVAAEVYTGAARDETNLPLGHPILIGGYHDRNAIINAYIAGDAYGYSYSSGTLLSGSWRMRGSFTSPEIGLAQRMA